MTVLEASNKLVNFFTKNDYFQPEEHFKSICLISDTDADKACIDAALGSLEKAEVVVKKVFDDKTYWILIKPISLHSQDVQISVLLGAEISETLSEKLGEEANCNPLKITEMDILSLLLLVRKEKS